MKAPYKRILAALDRAASADTVFEQAIALAVQNNSHLILTHCLSLKTLEQLSKMVDAGYGLVSSAKLRQLQDDYLNEVNETWLWLCEYALQSQRYGICPEIRCETGNAIQICDLAQQWKADLIVIGHGGKPSIKKKLFGSTTNCVVQHAPCSVIVVQPPSTQHLPDFEMSNSLRKLHLVEQSMWNFSTLIANTL